MTTGSDALPSPQDRTTPAVDPAAALQPAATLPETTDPDEIEWREAVAAARAEEAAAGDPPADPANPGTATPAVVPAKDPKDTPAAADVPMIPKARLDEVLSERDKLREQNAFLAGKAEGLAHRVPGAKPGDPVADPAPQTPEARIAAIRTEKQALAAQFDSGEITLKDYETQRDALDDKVHAIREEAFIAKVQPAAAASDTLYLDSETAALEIAHPWVGVLDKVGKKSDWDYFKALAQESLAEKQIDISGGGQRASFVLRKEMAALIDKLGPALLTERAKAENVALPGAKPAETPAPGGERQLSEAAKQRLAKLNLHEQHPPNVGTIAGNLPANGEYDDARIESMTEADYDALPVAVQRRLKGIAP